MDAAAVDDDPVGVLSAAALAPVGYLANASNHTLLVRVGDTGLHGVYKPEAGERPLWDFPARTLARREVAAYVVDVALGWGLVPPTVLRDGPLGRGSLQLFVPHDPRRHYFTLVTDPAHHEALARMATFDLLINNADRKGSHVLLAEDGRILGCDHGLAFHREPKLRTVIWDLAGTRILRAWRADARRLAGVLADPGSALRVALTPLLAAEEVDALGARARAVAAADVLPEPDEERRAYPWPPL